MSANVRRYTEIIGTGRCLGPIAATNEDIAGFFPRPDGDAWTPAWVERRLGIKTRRSAFAFRTGRLLEEHHDGDMACRAALAAIEDAKIDPAEIDRVIYATSTPEELMPDPACVLHGRLGLPLETSAIGLTAVGCGGFIYAMDRVLAARVRRPRQTAAGQVRTTGRVPRRAEAECGRSGSGG